MILRMLKIAFILLVCCTSSACLRGRVDKSTHKQDESRITEAKQIDSISVREIDSIKLKDFLSYFKSVNIPQILEKDNKIPVQLASEILNVSFDTLYDVSVIYSLGYLEKDNIKTMFYKIDCMAGSICARYYVAYIDCLKNRLLKTKLIVVDSGTPEGEIEHTLKLTTEGFVEIQSDVVEYNEDYDILLDSSYISKLKLGIE